MLILLYNVLTVRIRCKHGFKESATLIHVKRLRNTKSNTCRYENNNSQFYLYKVSEKYSVNRQNNLIEELVYGHCRAFDT